MHTQFRMIDAPSRPQVPTIEFRDLTTPDDCPDLSWLVDESRYTDESAADRRKAEQQDQDRLDAYNRGDWSMIGLQCQATIYIPAGGSSFAVYTLTSPGVWGVESDAAADYHGEILADERSTLRKHLTALADAWQAIRDA